MPPLFISLSLSTTLSHSIIHPHSTTMHQFITILHPTKIHCSARLHKFITFQLYSTVHHTNTPPHKPHSDTLPHSSILFYPTVLLYFYTITQHIILLHSTILLYYTPIPSHYHTSFYPCPHSTNSQRCQFKLSRASFTTQHI